MKKSPSQSQSKESSAEERLISYLLCDWCIYSHFLVDVVALPHQFAKRFHVFERVAAFGHLWNLTSNGLFFPAGGLLFDGVSHEIAGIPAGEVA